MPSLYRWSVLLVFLFPISTLAAFIVDNFIFRSTKPALTCTPFLLQWQGGLAPWTLRVLQANNSEVLEDLGIFQVTAFNWNVDLAAGTSVQIELQDSLGAIALSNALTIEPGSTGCISISSTGTAQPTTTQQTTTTRASSSTATRATSSTPLGSFTSSARIGSAPLSTDVTPGGSSLAFAVSTTVSPLSSSTLGVGSAAETGTEASSTTAPEALSKVSTPLGVILGVAIPGLVLLLFFCFFIFRRRQTPADSEDFLYPVDLNPNFPAWFMRQAYHTESAGVSYGSQISSSYRATVAGTEPSMFSIAPSDSDQFSPEYAEPVIPTEQRMQTVTFP
ncbi:hypothetical protein C8R45DRAFT_1002563 [Mycena sanguinolenta]|nr:hypothetical protein C8R45DRAFT_1002563 [Mycena sanguinolenta]